MHQWTKLVVIVAASAFVAAAATSQPADGRGRFEGRGGGFGGFNLPDPFPGIMIMAALDADKDGALSANEIANATAALKKLDKNGDGKVGQDELRPPREERGGRRGGFRGGFGSGNLLDRYDKNADGKISASELPERMRQGLMNRADKNGDGFLEKSEIEALSQDPGNRGRNRGGPGGNQGGRPPRPTRPE